MEEKIYKIIYLIGIIITSVLMLLLLFTGNVSLNFTFLVFFYVVKFLAGFGLILSISNGFLLLMDKLSNKLGKRGTIILIVIEIIIPALLIGYAIYKIISSYTEAAAVTQTGLWLWFDNIIYIYGIISLLLNLYIIPLASEQFHKAAEISKLSFWKKRAKNVARKIKKEYFSLRKEYAKAQVQDQMAVKDILNLWRNKFAVNLLLILAIGSFLFMPIAFICILYWLHLYIFYRLQIRLWEKALLLIGMIWIGLIAVIIPFLSFPYVQEIWNTIDPYFWSVNVLYLVGICLATFIFVKKILNLQGITISGLKIELKDRKIERLEQEKEELEKKLKDKEASVNKP
jgi:MFS family permease